MRTLLIALVMIVAMGWAEKTYSLEYLEEKQFKDWTSFILKDGELMCSRIGTGSADRGVFLAIDLYPGRCETGRISLHIVSEKTKADAARVTIPGSLRVDTNEIVDISYNAYARDKLIILEVEGASGERVFRDALKGQTLRFQVRPPKGNNIYSRFSLSGITAAYERARTLCDILRGGAAGNGGEEKYFAPTPPSERAPQQDQGLSRL